MHFSHYVCSITKNMWYSFGLEGQRSRLGLGLTAIRRGFEVPSSSTSDRFIAINELTTSFVLVKLCLAENAKVAYLESTDTELNTKEKYLPYFVFK